MGGIGFEGDPKTSLVAYAITPATDPPTATTLAAWLRQPAAVTVDGR